MMYLFILLAAFPTIISALTLNSVDDLTSNSGEDLAPTSNSLEINIPLEQAGQDVSFFDTDSLAETPDTLSNSLIASSQLGQGSHGFVEGPEIEQDLTSDGLNDSFEPNIVDSDNRLPAGTESNYCSSTHKRQVGEVGSDRCTLRLDQENDVNNGQVKDQVQVKDPIQGENNVDTKPAKSTEMGYGPKCKKGETPICCELIPVITPEGTKKLSDCNKCK